MQTKAAVKIYSESIRTVQQRIEDYVEFTGVMPDQVLPIATQNEDYEVVEYLLKKGARPDTKDPSGSTALVRAIEVGDIDLVKLLIEYGADVNQVMRHLNETPLIYAAHYGDQLITAHLLENGADPLIKNTNGETAFGIAFRLGKTNIIGMLKDYTDAWEQKNGNN